MVGCSWIAVLTWKRTLLMRAECAGIVYWQFFLRRSQMRTVWSSDPVATWYLSNAQTRHRFVVTAGRAG